MTVLDEMAPMTAAQWGYLWHRTFDELRDTPRLCTCGQHAYTGGGHGLGCPWRREQPGRWGVVWAQPDREGMCE